MPGHLLLYHPGVRKLKEIVGAGELGDVLCVYGNRQNLGIIRSNENALWSLGVHDLSVILYLLDEDPESRSRTAATSCSRASRTSSSATCGSRPGRIAHMHLSWLDPHKMRKITVVGTEKMVVFDDMELERKVTVYEKAPWRPSDRTASGRRAPATSSARRSRPTSRSSSSAASSSRLVSGEGDRRKVASDGARVVRALDMLTSSLRMR